MPSRGHHAAQIGMLYFRTLCAMARSERRIQSLLAVPLLMATVATCASMANTSGSRRSASCGARILKSIAAPHISKPPLDLRYLKRRSKHRRRAFHRHRNNWHRPHGQMTTAPTPSRSSPLESTYATTRDDQSAQARVRGMSGECSVLPIHEASLISCGRSCVVPPPLKLRRARRNADHSVATRRRTARQTWPAHAAFPSRLRSSRYETCSPFRPRFARPRNSPPYSRRLSTLRLMKPGDELKSKASPRYSKTRDGVLDVLDSENRQPRSCMVSLKSSHTACP